MTRVIGGLNFLANHLTQSTTRDRPIGLVTSPCQSSRPALPTSCEATRFARGASMHARSTPRCAAERRIVEHDYPPARAEARLVSQSRPRLAASLREAQLRVGCCAFAPGSPDRARRAAPCGRWRPGVYLPVWSDALR